MLMVILCLWASVGGAHYSDQIFPYHRNFFANVRRVHGVDTVKSLMQTKAVFFEKSPRIICSEKTIGIEYPKGEFAGGRIFTSKHEDEPSCVRHFASNDETAKFELPLQFMPCGLESKKMDYPKPGVEYTLKVVVSFDHSRMTEEDEIFSLTCRYLTQEKKVGTIMEVSPYSKTYLIGENSTPNCRYTLHLDSIDGPPADNSQLGDKVYHVWECDTHSYAVKVYECYVHDGFDKKYMLIDDKGCSSDSSIMPELTYDPNLNFIYASSKVFKFSDSSKMHFNCLLYMCPKSDPTCREHVPPACGNNERKKRFSSLRNGMHQLTLNSSIPYRGFRDLEKASLVLHDDPMDPEGFLHAVESPPVQPVIQYQPPKHKPKTECPDEGYGEKAFVILVVCNLITLVIATGSMWTIYRKRFSAKLSISEK